MERFARNFGSKVKELRTARGMTQAQLAALADVGPNYVPRIERGEMTPAVDTAHRIARALGASIDELCGSTPRDSLQDAARTLVALTDVEMAAFKRAVRAVDEVRARLRSPVAKGDDEPRPRKADGAPRKRRRDEQPL